MIDEYVCCNYVQQDGPRKWLRKQLHRFYCWWQRALRVSSPLETKSRCGYVMVERFGFGSVLLANSSSKSSRIRCSLLLDVLNLKVLTIAMYVRDSRNNQCIWKNGLPKSVNNSNVSARLKNGCECARLWYLNRHTDFVRALSTILYAKEFI